MERRNTGPWGNDHYALTGQSGGLCERVGLDTGENLGIYGKRQWDVGADKDRQDAVGLISPDSVLAPHAFGLDIGDQARGLRATDRRAAVRPI
jgi:hypothetical protein